MGSIHGVFVACCLSGSTRSGVCVDLEQNLPQSYTEGFVRHLDFKFKFGQLVLQLSSSYWSNNNNKYSFLMTYFLIGKKLLEGNLVTSYFLREKVFALPRVSFEKKVWSQTITFCENHKWIHLKMSNFILCALIVCRDRKKAWPYFPEDNFSIQTNITMTHFCKYFECAWSVFVTYPTPRSADNVLTHTSRSASASNW